jgi:hypothetical protein
MGISKMKSKLMDEVASEPLDKPMVCADVSFDCDGDDDRYHNHGQKSGHTWR